MVTANAINKTIKDGGAIDGTAIGGTTAAAGTFTAMGCTSATLTGVASGYADSEEVALQAGVQTTDATVTQIAAIVIPDNTMVSVEARINGFISDYSASCCGFVQYGARRIAAGAVEVAEPILNILEDSTGAPVVDVDVSGNNVRLLVTGIVAETWNWSVSYRYNFLKTSA